MFIYFFLAFCTLILGTRFTKYRKINYDWLFILLLFIGIFRDVRTGGDNAVYSENFSATTMNPDTWSAYTEFEPGFSWIMAFFKTYISQEYVVFMGFIFLIFMLGVNYIIKKESCNTILSLFFLIILLHYTKSFNIMRQSFTLGLFCFILPLVKGTKKEVIGYVLLVILLTFFAHRSLIIMIIPLLFYLKSLKSILYNRKVISIILILSYTMVYMSEFLYSKIPLLVLYLSFLGERYTGYLSTSVNADITVSKLSSLLDVLMGILIIHWYPKEQKDNKFQTFCYASYICSIIVANILGSMSDLFLRISVNLAFCRILYFTYLWHNIRRVRSQKLFRVVICCYGFIIFTNALIKNFGLVVPYINRLF